MNGTTEPMSGAPTVMGGIRRRHLLSDDHRRKIAIARERFAGGDDAVRGVRPEILMSWYRCREQYQVDPRLARAPDAPGSDAHSIRHDVVFAELGGIAARAGDDIAASDGLVTVADGEGQILASWGNEAIMRRAAESNLAPWSAWSEWASGTNGMGTALESRGPVVIRGPEHWCEGFQEWVCAGVAVHDAVTDDPLAVLNVSCWNTPVCDSVIDWLNQASAHVQARLREHAGRGGEQLVAAFTAASSKGPKSATRAIPLAALDRGGKVVIASEEAALYLGVRADAPALDPACRPAPQLPELTRLTRLAVQRAERDPTWVGWTQVFVPLLGGCVPVALRPVLAVKQVVGVLAAFGSADGDPLGAESGGQPPPAAPQQHSATLNRVIGLRGDRLVLLTLSEIRYAESDGSTVWLTCDQGRLRAATQGFDNLERQLAREGFLRVHRRFLVNLRRVREIERGFKGALLLVTDARTHEVVPVSRRHAPTLRRVLGL